MTTAAPAIFSVDKSRPTSEEKEKAAWMSTWFAFVTKVAMVAAAIFGFLGYLFVIIQLDTLGPWNISISYSIIMGVLWVVLVGIAIAGRKYLEEERLDAVAHFLLYYTVVYTITMFWQWFFLKINYKDAPHGTPPSTTDESLMGYMGFCVIQVFFSFFFQIYGLHVLNSSNESGDGIKSMVGLNRQTYRGMLIGFKVVAALCIFFGLFFSFLQFFYLSGSSFSDLKTQMWLYVTFLALYVIQFVLYAILRYRNATINVLSQISVEHPPNTAHWNELDATQLFLFLTVFLNLGPWIVFWAGPDRDYNNSYKFGSGAPYYYTFVGVAMFNSILIGWYMYYLVTALSMSTYAVSGDYPGYTRTVNLGPRSILSSLFGYRDARTSVLSLKDKNGTTVLNDNPRSRMRWAFMFLFMIGFVWQVLYGVFVLVTLINTDFMARQWLVWAWLFTVINCAFWVLLFIRSFMYVASFMNRSEGYNMMVFCKLFRPLFTYTVCIFIVSYGMFELQRENGTDHGISDSVISDASKFAYVKYWALMTTQLGVAVLLVLTFKDIVGSFMPGAMTFLLEPTADGDVVVLPYKGLPVQTSDGE